MKGKIRIKNRKIILIAVFALAMMAGFGFGKTEKASAAGTCTYSLKIPKSVDEASNVIPEYWINKSGPANDNDGCQQYCQNDPNNVKDCKFSGNVNYSITNPDTSPAAQQAQADAQQAAQKQQAQLQAQQDAAALQSKQDQEVCGKLDYLPGVNLIKCLLLLFLRFVSSLLSVAATIFAWMVKPDTMLRVMGDPIVYKMWALVRDVLNIAFILVLLFSAFCTIFQVASYNYKKILLNLIIMALLVNFSFPIARVIIDVANVIMYFFLNNLPFGSGTTTANLFANIANNSELKTIIGVGKSADTWLIISAIVFTFILAVTFLAIGILLIIRTVALTILIIFSSVAFVGSIVPNFSSEAKKWWSNLFRYAFFGPTMIFMIYIATNMISKIGTAKNDVMSIANAQTADKDIIAAISFFALPIVILWIGIGFAQSSSVAGAKFVMGGAANAMKGIGNWTARAPFRGAWWTARQTGIPGGLAAKWNYYKKSGKFFGSDKREERESRIAGTGPFAVPKALEQLHAKKVKEAHEKLATEYMTKTDLDEIAKKGNMYEKAAAIQKLAERGQATDKNLDDVRDAFGDTSHVFRELAARVRTYNPAAAFSYVTNATKREEMIQEFVTSNQFDKNKIGLDSLANEEFMKIAIANNAFSAKDLLDIAKTNPNKKTNIQNALAGLAISNVDSSDETSKKIHQALFAQTGNIANADFAEHIFTYLNADLAANMTENTANTYSEHMARFTKDYKKTLQGIRNDTAKRVINDATQQMDALTLSALPTDQSNNASSAQRISNKDPQLKNLNSRPERRGATTQNYDEYTNYV